MKYLQSRGEFIKRSIEKIDAYNEYEKYSTPEYDLILEDSGPFANDIPWGDSLLGRLINSTMRKAKIQANLLVMSGVVKRLKRAFDDLLIESKANTLEKSDLEKVAKILLFTALYNLEKAVKNLHIEKTELEELKNLTQLAIDKVEETEDLPKKNELMRQLEEWQKFLNSLKEEDNIESGDENPEKRGEKKSEEKLYTLRLANFKSSLRLVNLVIRDQQKRAAAVVPHLAGNKSFRGGALTDKEKEELAKSQTTSTGATQQTTTVTQPVTKGSANIGSKESYSVNFNWDGLINEEVNPPLPPSPPKSPVYPLLKKLHGTVVQILPPKEKGQEIEDIIRFMKFSDAELMSDKFKNPITKVYEKVEKICKKGDIASSEDIMNLLSRPDDLGQRIGELYLISKTRDDGKFEGLSEEMQVEISTFNKTMKACLYSELQFGKKEEGVLKKYAEFRKIYEADEKPEESVTKDKSDKNQTSEEGKVGQKPKSGFVDKIQTWWTENMNIAEWMMKKSEVEKTKVELDKKLAEKKDSVVIPDMDPILEICKIFNRAYRIHTTQVIPSGRTGGRVSNKTFMEYTSFGGGSPASAGESGGPYRNNKLFSTWYDGVMDIMKEKKYQPIFNVATRIKVGNEFIDRAGSNLRKFMSDMLDGDDFYKSGKDGQGAQAKFLDKYFGYKDDKDLDKKVFYEGSAEKDTITGLSDQIKQSQVRWVIEPKKYTTAGELKGSFFAAITRDNEATFFYVEQTEGDNIVYVCFSNSWDFCKGWLSTKSIKMDTSEGSEGLLSKNWEKYSKSGRPFEVYGAMLDIKKFITTEGKPVPGRKKVNAIVKKDNKIETISPDEWTWDSIYTLVELKEGTVGGEEKRYKDPGKKPFGDTLSAQTGIKETGLKS